MNFKEDDINMAQNQFQLVLVVHYFFDGDNLIGVAKTLTESTFNFSISNEEIRGGQGNALFGKYFHDSNLSYFIDANVQNILPLIGVDISMGLSESSGKLC